MGTAKYSRFGALPPLGTTRDTYFEDQYKIVDAAFDDEVDDDWRFLVGQSL